MIRERKCMGTGGVYVCIYKGKNILEEDKKGVEFVMLIFLLAR